MNFFSSLFSITVLCVCTAQGTQGASAFKAHPHNWPFTTVQGAKTFSPQTSARLYPLTRAPGIPFTVTRKEGPYGWEHIEHTFQSLTQEQFSQLSLAYKPPPTLVYSPHEAYTLSDFFPKPIQVLAGTLFSNPPVAEKAVEALVSLIREKVKSSTPSGEGEPPWWLNPSVTLNCWGASYEVARHLADPLATTLDIGHIGNKHAGFRLSSPRFSTFIKRTDTESLLNPQGWDSLEKDLEPGDVLMIWGTVTKRNPYQAYKQLLHAMVFLDKGLYFQKAGLDNEAISHITTSDDIATTYFTKRLTHRGVTTTPETVFIHRFGTDGTAPLPPISQGFGQSWDYEPPLGPVFASLFSTTLFPHINWTISLEYDFSPINTFHRIAPFITVPLSVSNTSKGSWGISTDIPFDTGSGDMWGNSHAL